MSNLTKKALADALKKKLKEKDLAHITIKELTDECGLNRQTFYYHFNDIYDLIKWLYTNEVMEELKFDNPENSWHNASLYLFEYVKKNKNLVDKTYNSIAREYFTSYLGKQVSDFSAKIIEEKTKNMKINDDLKKFLSNYYKNTLIDTIRDWALAGMKEKPIDITTKIDSLLDGSIELFLKNYQEKTRQKDKNV